MSEPEDKNQPIEAQEPVSETKPTAAQKRVSDTQPVKTIQSAQAPKPAQEKSQEMQVEETKEKKPGRAGKFITNLLIFVVIIGVGLGGGYQAGIGDRQRAEQATRNEKLSDQFARALVDMEFGNYAAAKQRLEYIINLDPTYPGAREKLTEVLVLSTIPTETPYISPTPTIVIDTTDLEGLFQQAAALVAAGEWQTAVTVLDTLRKEELSYKTSQVDGMYYYSLRNWGVDLIKAGNLEGGIYQLTLAERFGPLDNTAIILRDNARFYITAASFWELDWRLSVEYFSQLNGSGLWDGTMTATERYRIASMRYGDQLYLEEQYCAAYQQYQNSAALGQLDPDSAKYSNQSYQACYPPTPTATEPSLIEPSPTEPPSTQPPPTEPPPTEPPPTEPPQTETS
jgi:tetratricopeptide (TPR) repeat protein